MTPTRVLLADDHPALRAGVRSLLERIPGVTVVAEADDGRDTVMRAQALRPDVVMLDLAMPDQNGLEALEQIVATCPTTRVIVLTGYANEEYVLRAMRSGAAGYVLKTAGPDELARALEAVAAGGTFISPSVASALADYVRRSGQNPAILRPLPPRQREVLKLIADGRSTKEIADQLSISVKTVEMHRARLMERLQIHDVAGLVRYAIRNGLVEE